MLPERIGSKANTLGRQHLQPPEVGAYSEPVYTVRVVDHGTDELLVQQDSIPDGQTTSVQDWTRHSYCYDTILSVPSDMRRPGQPRI